MEGCARSKSLTVPPSMKLVVTRCSPRGARGGIPFVQQPYLVVKDAGGNILEADSVSYATVSISNNPSGASLRSDPRFYLRNEELDLYTLVPHTVQLKNGEATFSNIAIDKVGREFRLKFSVYARDNSGREGTNFYGWTGERYTYSDTFDVTHGDPTALVVITKPADAWAGGSPFGQQPVIGITDAGGNIMTPDSTSTVTATLAEDRGTGFPLLGTKTLIVALGVVSFLDLTIKGEANDYVITFSTSAGSFTKNASLDVIPSTEFILINSEDRQAGDKMGSSCATDDQTNLIAVGAVGEDRPVDEVQVITTEGGAAVLRSEVQLVKTLATPLPEIQSIKFSCHPGSSIARRSIPSGNDGMTSFQLEWTDPKSGNKSLSRPIAAEMPGPMMAAFLEADLAGLGPVEVSRLDDRDTADSCNGGCDFRVTFISCEDYVPELILKNVVFETQAIAPTAAVTRIRSSTILGGTFTLTMPIVQHAGHGAHCESTSVGMIPCSDPILQDTATTDPIPFNASAEHVAREIQRSIWYLHDRHKNDSKVNRTLAIDRGEFPGTRGAMVTASRTPADPERGHTWSVTFVATDTLYDPPQMSIETTMTTGYKVCCERAGTVKTNGEHVVVVIVGLSIARSRFGFTNIYNVFLGFLFLISRFVPATGKRYHEHPLQWGSTARRVFPYAISWPGSCLGWKGHRAQYCGWW